MLAVGADADFGASTGGDESVFLGEFSGERCGSNVAMAFKSRRLMN